MSLTRTAELEPTARPSEARSSPRLSASRALTNRLMFVICGCAVLLALWPLGSLFWLVVSRGAPAISWSFLTSLPAPPEEGGGGIGNALVGTLYLVGLASLMGLPLGFGIGFYLAERGDGRMGNMVRLCTECWGAIPSIVLGVVGYAVMVLSMRRFSAFAGSVVLALVMVPSLARATEEVVRLVPAGLREASLALGVSASHTTLFVVLPTALPGVLTAALLGLARASGETAPLLFTALNSQHFSWRPDRPIASLTVQIYNLALSPFPHWHEQAWGAALCLLVLMAVSSLGARALSRRGRP